ncbi:sensor histidine kinase [Spirillospora sp. NPDC050679]
MKRPTVRRSWDRYAFGTVRRAGPAGRTDDDLPLRLARAMLWASFGIVFYIRLFSGLDNGAGLVGALLPALSYPPLVALAMWCWSPAVRYGLLAAVALGHLVPFLVVGERWDWVPWTVAAAVLCALPRRVAWPLFVLVVAASGAAVLLFGHGLVPGHDGQLAVGYMIIAVDDGLIVYGLSALVRAVEQLHGTREELARAALAGERLRLDGELRELLGGRLQAIAFRMRKAGGAREAADTRDDLREGVALARHALAEVRAAAGAYRARSPAGPPTPPPARPPVESPLLARRVLLAVLVVQCVLVMTVLASLHPADRPLLGLAAALLAAIVVLQALPRSRTTLVAQSLLILLPLAVFPDAWDRLLSIFTGTLLLVLRPPRSWAVAGAVLAAHLAWLLHSIDGGALYIDDLAAALAGFGGHIMIMWLVYCLGRLSELLAVLERARHDLAEAAVRRERTRVAGDLHDVLGFSLSAVALKGEVAERLWDADPERAAATAASLAPLVEQALAELRSITGDGIELRLQDELAMARAVLRDAGIEAAVHAGIGPLPPGTDTAVAAALRETVTNVLRHSRARTCDITVSAVEGGVRLRVVNDGVAPVPDPAAGRRGTGLASLARRTGGRMTAGHLPDGGFEVAAEFRLDPTGLYDAPDRIGPVADPRHWG